MDSVLTAVLYANISGTLCPGIIVDLVFKVVSVFSALRMYAISERNTKLAALVIGLGIAHVCANAVSILIVEAGVAKGFYSTQTIWASFYRFRRLFPVVHRLSSPEWMFLPFCAYTFRCLRLLCSLAFTSRRENRPFTTTYRVAAYIGTASTILSELILQLYTWRKTLRIRQKLRSRNMNNSLFSLLLRDGEYHT